MEKQKDLWEKIKSAEKILLSASPKEAAKLTDKIVKWRRQVFNETR